MIEFELDSNVLPEIRKQQKPRRRAGTKSYYALGLIDTFGTPPL